MRLHTVQILWTLALVGAPFLEVFSSKGKNIFSIRHHEICHVNVVEWTQMLNLYDLMFIFEQLVLFIVKRIYIDSIPLLNVLSFFLNRILPHLFNTAFRGLINFCLVNYKIFQDFFLLGYPWCDSRCFQVGPLYLGLRFQYRWQIGGVHSRGNNFLAHFRHLNGDINTGSSLWGLPLKFFLFRFLNNIWMTILL